jgi:hypothetical protein
VCISLGLKKPGDFTVSEGHGLPLVNFIFAKQVMGICAPTHFPKEIRREGGRKMGRGMKGLGFRVCR